MPETPQLDARALLYMALLALQFGVQPVLTRRYTPPAVARSTVVLTQEAVKFLMALAVLRASGQSRRALQDWTLRGSVAVALLPAALYAVQNMCALMAYQNLDALTYNVLNQTKTLSAALCCYLVMGKTQSRLQVVALLLLVVASLVVEGVISVERILTVMSGDGSVLDRLYGSSDPPDSMLPHDAKHWTHGVLPILVASFISGMTGALTQKSLQSTNGGRNPYLFSMELCVGGLVVLLANLVLSQDGSAIVHRGFFHGWTPLTMIPVLTNAAGGIIVGLVTKYAGSVRKGFALIFGLLFSGIVQTLTSSEGISRQHVVGGTLAAISLYLHAAFPPAQSSLATEKKKKK